MKLSAALRAAAVQTAAHWRDFMRIGLPLQVLSLLVSGPVLALLLWAALRAAGVPSLTEASIGQVIRHPLALVLLLAMAAAATATVLVQHGGFVLLARELAAGRRPRARDLARESLRVSRRLAGPQAALLALYALVLAPLGGLTLGASLTRGIELPPFIAGELQKTPLGTWLWLLLTALVLWLNLRLVFIPTVLLTTEAGPAAAFRASWRLSRGRAAGLAAATAGAGALAAVLAGGLAVGAVGLTRLADSAWPPAAPVVAGLTVTVVQAALLLLSALLGAYASAVLLLLSAAAAPGGTELRPDQTHPAWLTRPAVAGALVVGLTLGAVVNAGALQRAGSGRTTAVVAHRGATYGAVENTLSSLEAAATLGADYVELDVLQARDGGLVVLHDTNLRRIAGVNRNVFDMTTAELTATPIRQGSRTDRIPTFDEFAARAAELGVPLLVEVKEHGRESGDLLGDVVAVLRQHGLVETARVQGFNRELVAELEGRFPAVNTGLVVAFSRGRLDPGAADFVTLEQTSYSRAVLGQAHAQGVGVFVWTVTDELRMRLLMRDGVDGLITGYPSRALEQRAEVAERTSVGERLEETLRSLTDW